MCVCGSIDGSALISRTIHAFQITSFRFEQNLHMIDGRRCRKYSRTEVDCIANEHFTLCLFYYVGSDATKYGQWISKNRFYFILQIEGNGILQDSCSFDSSGCITGKKKCQYSDGQWFYVITLIENRFAMSLHFHVPG